MAPSVEIIDLTGDDEVFQEFCVPALTASNPSPTIALSGNHDTAESQMGFERPPPTVKEEPLQQLPTPVAATLTPTSLYAGQKRKRSEERPSAPLLGIKIAPAPSVAADLPDVSSQKARDPFNTSCYADYILQLSKSKSPEKLKILVDRISREAIQSQIDYYAKKVPDAFLRGAIRKAREQASSRAGDLVKSIMESRRLQAEPGRAYKYEKRIRKGIKRFFDVEVEQYLGCTGTRTSPDQTRTLNYEKIEAPFVAPLTSVSSVSGDASQHAKAADRQSERSPFSASRKVKHSPSIEHEDRPVRRRPSRTSADIAAQRISILSAQEAMIKRNNYDVEFSESDLSETPKVLGRSSMTSMVSHSSPPTPVSETGKKFDREPARPIPTTWEEADPLDKTLMILRLGHQSWRELTRSFATMTGSKIPQSTLYDRYQRLTKALGGDYIRKHAEAEKAEKTLRASHDAPALVPTSLSSYPCKNPEGSDYRKICDGPDADTGRYKPLMNDIQLKHPERHTEVAGVAFTREGFQEIIDAAPPTVMINAHANATPLAETSASVVQPPAQVTVTEKGPPQVPDSLHHCPFKYLDGSDCQKVCDRPVNNPKRYQYLVNHISSKHPERFMAVAGAAYSLDGLREIIDAAPPATMINAQVTRDLLAEMSASVIEPSVQTPEHGHSIVSSSLLHCPFKNDDGSGCDKVCDFPVTNPRRYQYLINHIQLKHPERYTAVANVAGTRDGLQEIIDAAPLASMKAQAKAIAASEMPVSVFQPDVIATNHERDGRHGAQATEVLGRSNSGGPSSVKNVTVEQSLADFQEEVKILLPPKRAPKRPEAGTAIASLAAKIALSGRRPLRETTRPVEYIIHEHDQLDLIEQESILKSVSFNALPPETGSDHGVNEQALAGKTHSFFTMLESQVKDPNLRPAKCVGSLLRHREMGSSNCGRHVEGRSELNARITEQIRPWRWWTGASHDVVTVAWAPDSNSFAAGAAAHSNDEDLQYNRPCNLLLGDLQTNSLKELPDHWIERKIPQSGPNASQIMYDSCDPRVYKTVTSVRFNAQGTEMYSASEDQTVKVWDMASKTCEQSIKHGAAVTSLEASRLIPGSFATGSKTINDAVRVFSPDRQAKTAFTSSRAEQRPDWNMYPECLAWGSSNENKHLLLGGFQQWGGEDEATREGHLCLWDLEQMQEIKVTPNSQAIHALAWHPTMSYFASGGTPGSIRTDKRNTQTVIRIYDVRLAARHVMEYECRANEMMDVTFDPHNPNVVTAGCTDCSSYIWDYRRPDRPLHTLRHRPSIMPRGERDTGVMMSLWAPLNPLYYTGSSDGSVFTWDIRRAPEDVHVGTVAHVGAGIQSGAFSPDGSHLLVGDATGGIHVLSSAPWAPYPEHDDTDDDIARKGVPMDIDRATRPVIDDDPGTEGRDAVRELLRTEAITIHPEFGPGQGPKYSGPFAACHRESREDGGKPRYGLKREMYRMQPLRRSGKVREQYAYPIRALVAARRYALGSSESPETQDANIRDTSFNGSDREFQLEALTDRHKELPKASSRLVSALRVLRQLLSEIDSTEFSIREQMSLDHLRRGQPPNPLSAPSSFSETITIAAFLINIGLPRRLSNEESSVLGHLKSEVYTDPSRRIQTMQLWERVAKAYPNYPLTEAEMLEEDYWWPDLGADDIANALKHRPVNRG